MEDIHNLDRFLSAQDSSYESIINELKQGQKQGHWMWYIFPQVDGLGFSSTSRHYSIKSKLEAIAYLNHPVLGKRLIECTQTVIFHDHLSAEKIFGYPDYLKFHSCITLFNEISKKENPFQKAIDQFYEGKTDPKTLELLKNL